MPVNAPARNIIESWARLRTSTSVTFTPWQVSTNQRQWQCHLNTHLRSAKASASYSVESPQWARTMHGRSVDCSVDCQLIRTNRWCRAVLSLVKQEHRLWRWEEDPNWAYQKYQPIIKISAWVWQEACFQIEWRMLSANKWFKLDLNQQSSKRKWQIFQRWSGENKSQVCERDNIWIRFSYIKKLIICIHQGGSKVARRLHAFQQLFSNSWAPKILGLEAMILVGFSQQEWLRLNLKGKLKITRQTKSSLVQWSSSRIQ